MSSEEKKSSFPDGGKGTIGRRKKPRAPSDTLITAPSSKGKKSSSSVGGNGGGGGSGSGTGTGSGGPVGGGSGSPGGNGGGVTISISGGNSSPQASPDKAVEALLSPGGTDYTVLRGDWKEEDEYASDSDDERMDAGPHLIFHGRDEHQVLLEKVLEATLKGMGMSHLEAQETIIMVHGRIREVPRRHLVDPATQSVMRHLVDNCAVPYLESQKELKKIITVQKMYRGRRARRQWKEYKALYVHTQLGQRLDAFRELVKVERKYNAQLTTLVKGFYFPLISRADARGTIIRRDECTAVFRHIRRLRAIHSSFLKKLLARRDKHWPCVDWVGRIFLDVCFVKSRFSVYEKFAREYQLLLLIMRNCEKREKFAAFIQELSVKTKMQQLLSVPLKQNNAYARQFEKLLERTPTDGSHDQDIADLSEARELTSQVVWIVRDGLDRSSHVSPLLELSMRVVREAPPLSRPIEEFNQAVVREGEVSYLDPKKRSNSKGVPLKIFLLSHSLFLGKSIQSGAGVQLKSGVLHLSHVSVEDLPDSYSRNAVSICTSSEAHVISFKSLEDKASWTSDISRLMKACRPQTCFGMSLSEIVERETRPSGIPVLVEKVVCCVISKAMHMDGLFTKPTNAARMNLLVAEISKGIQNVDFARFDYFCVANLLKTFFREMPEPILTFAVYETVAGLSLDQVNNGELSVDEVMQGLPKHNRDCLEYVLMFFIRLSKHSDTNKMTIQTAARVLAPNLLFPRETTLEAARNTPKVSAFILRILEAYELRLQELLLFTNLPTLVFPEEDVNALEYRPVTGGGFIGRERQGSPRGSRKDANQPQAKIKSFPGIRHHNVKQVKEKPQAAFPGIRHHKVEEPKKDVKRKSKSSKTDKKKSRNIGSFISRRSKSTKAMGGGQGSPEPAKR
eukprot:TRINITY_DN7041_c0_g1_i1.p1 TRINITY_DN7041_c0_g1~~TRINITY_DN7041_c0_g1_i1.p1  ORF type:complete len:962 (+),score=188.84 TRINITY_DN7041_c0_g1_i1:171-2888(+)